MNAKAAGLLLWPLLAGCATVPFEAPPKADFRGVDPHEVAEGFDRRVAKRFELVESVVFRVFGREMTGLGYLAVDGDAGTYALSCMTPAGIKLFEFRGRGDEVETLFVPPQLEAMKDRFAESVAQDIRRIYFGWAPPPGAEPRPGRNRLVFKGRLEDGTRVEHVFEGPQRTLAGKRFSKGWKTLGTIRYFEYKEIGGKLYPHGIVLENRRYRYRLVLRVKSVSPMDRAAGAAQGFLK